MKKKYPRTAKDIKGPVALGELRRAHFIIVILALALSLILVLEAIVPVQLDPYLVIAAVTLLAVVALSSFVTAITLGKILNK